ncbi:hypothetical protein ACNHKD_08280 [Methylocystis sp. JAN1]|uniref:hypothetical protein n=1 Tax=Methylocystis sp. JAN1 TaxID=3397211 RepID=UPI003FA1EC87
MSVSFDHRRRHGDDEEGATRGRQGDEGSLWGFAYDRVEGVVHLTLAFTIVGGAAVILSSALFSPGAPLGGPLEKPAVAKQAKPAPAASVAAREAVPPTPAQDPPAPVAAKDPPPPVAPTRQAEPAPAAPAADLFLDAHPMTESAAPAASASAPEPLAPPSADMREKLVARQDAAPAPALGPQIQESGSPPPEASAYQAAPANAGEAREEAPDVPAKAVAEAPKAEEGGRMAKCYLKLSGRVQNSGSCRVDHTGENVIFHLPGKPLELAHDRGRVWTATLGGRNLGKVYKNKDAPCWGAKGFYACENG